MEGALYFPVLRIFVGFLFGIFIVPPGVFTEKLKKIYAKYMKVMHKISVESRFSILPRKNTYS